MELRMYTNLVTVVLLIGLSFTVSTHAGTVETDATAVRERLDELVDAYNRHDPEAVAAMFTSSADVASMSRFEGREQIEQFFRNLEGDPIEPISPTALIRFLRPDVAVIDIETMLSGVVGVNGVVLPDMMVKAFFVASKQNDRWFFEALRVRTLTVNPSR
jgi:uncharacterized protein (TIGR02246 family)